MSNVPLNLFSCLSCWVVCNGHSKAVRVTLATFRSTCTVVWVVELFAMDTLKQSVWHEQRSAQPVQLSELLSCLQWTFKSSPCDMSNVPLNLYSCLSCWVVCNGHSKAVRVTWATFRSTCTVVWVVELFTMDTLKQSVWHEQRSAQPEQLSEMLSCLQWTL